MAVELSRDAITLIADHLGKARTLLHQAYGDTNKESGARLAMETAFTRVHGSTLFHDTDYAQGFPLFGDTSIETNNIGLGLQGVHFVPDVATAYSYPALPSIPHPIWTPEYLGPPSPEGWGKFQYSPWAGWTRATIDVSEPSDAATIRATLQYPSRYDSTLSGTTAERYVRVPLWNSAKYISLYAGSSVFDGKNVKFNLSENDLQGVNVFDKDNIPQDIRIAYFDQLIQGGGNPATWEEINLPANKTQLKFVAFNIIYNISTALWEVTITIPSSITVPVGYWWHIILYLGSKDSYANAITPTYSYNNSLTTITLNSTDVIKWPRVNFFNKFLPDAIHEKRDRYVEYVNDSTPYVIAKKRLHLTLRDGEFSETTDPIRYPLPTMLPAATLPVEARTQDVNTINGYTNLSLDEAQTFLLVVHTLAGGFDASRTQFDIIPGVKLKPEFWPKHWSECPYFPVCPDDKTVVARFVVVAANKNTYGVARSRQANIGTNPYDTNYSLTSYNIHDTAIAFFEPVLHTFAQFPLADKKYALALLTRFFGTMSRLRTLSVGDPFADAAYRLIVPSVGTPINQSSSRSKLSQSESSRIFRGLLATPIYDRLLPVDANESLAIPLNEDARGVIYDLTGSEPVTELMRLSADRLSLTGEKLRKGTSLEIYMPPSDQCTAIDIGSAGNRLGLDYCLRLELLDENENVFLKDIDIMASKYFLTSEEYQRRVKASLPLTGYYTKSLLQNIDEFRLQGYAALIPDLSMGVSRPLLTRMVAPPDATKITEEDFRKQKQNQGLNQSQIDEAVLEFLEGGGEFYIVDTRQYPALFTSLRSVAISASTYTFDTIPHWNFSTDSFTVAGSNSVLPIGSLEQKFYDQSGFVIGVSSGNTDIEVLDNIDISGQPSGSLNKKQRKKIAVKIRINQDTTVAQYLFRLKVTHIVSNPLGTLTVSLATEDTNGNPGDILISGAPILYSDITTDYQDFRVDLPYILRANTNYWIVFEKSAILSGGTLVLRGYSSATDSLKYYQTFPEGLGSNGWVSISGAIYGGFFAPAPEIRAVFNREDWQVSQMLPGPNRARVYSSTYKVEGFTSYSPKPFSQPLYVYLYLRAVQDEMTEAWSWVAPSRDIWVMARFVVNGKIVESVNPLKIVNGEGVDPILLWPEPVEAICYLGIGKIESDLTTTTFGAPAGDYIVVRSAIKTEAT